MPEYDAEDYVHIEGGDGTYLTNPDGDWIVKTRDGEFAALGYDNNGEEQLYELDPQTQAAIDHAAAQTVVATLAENPGANRVLQELAEAEGGEAEPASAQASATAEPEHYDSIGDAVDAFNEELRIDRLTKEFAPEADDDEFE